MVGVFEFESDFKFISYGGIAVKDSEYIQRQRGKTRKADICSLGFSI